MKEGMATSSSSYELDMEALNQKKTQYRDSDGVLVTVIQEQALPPKKNDASSAVRDNDDDNREQQRKSKKCCGCCCDFRRAAIICSIVLMVLNILTIIIHLFAFGTLTTGVDVDDEDYDDFFQDYANILMGVEGISVLMNVLAIVGAIQYSVWMVAVSAGWMVVEFIAYIVVTIVMCNDWEDQDYYYNTDYYYYYYDYECSVNPFGVIIFLVVMICWLYPLIGFIVEVSKGNLSMKTTSVRSTYAAVCNWSQ